MVRTLLSSCLQVVAFGLGTVLGFPSAVVADEGLRDAVGEGESIVDNLREFADRLDGLTESRDNGPVLETVESLTRKLDTLEQSCESSRRRVVEYLDGQQGLHPPNGMPGNLGLPWLMNSQTDNPAVNAGVFSGFLNNRYDPVWTDFDGPGLHVAPKNTVPQTKRFKNPFGGTTPEGRFRMSPAARLSKDLSIERLGLRRSLLEQFERGRRDLDASLGVQAMDRQREVAMSLLTSSRVLDALDIDREPRALRERYGMTLFGQTCLAARRLIESGARFVTVLWDCFGQFANGAWDTHQYHYPRLKELLLPGFDLAYSALIEDMSSRGLLDETLVMWMSEHGRTPKILSLIHI